jgi:hypothetical protein
LLMYLAGIAVLSFRIDTGNGDKCHRNCHRRRSYQRRCGG